MKNIKFLKVEARPRYWEDADVNGVEDTEGTLIPCRKDDKWCPIIDIEQGKIINWQQGVVADIHYKVCDDGCYFLTDENDKILAHIFNGYVPEILSIGDEGYGDYIILKVDADGKIANFEINYAGFCIVCPLSKSDEIKFREEGKKKIILYVFYYFAYPATISNNYFHRLQKILKHSD